MQYPMLMIAALASLLVILCVKRVRESWVGWFVRGEFWFGITMLLRDYASVYTMHLAAGTLSPYWRIVIVRSSVTAEAVAPALLLLGAIALLEAGVVRRGTVFLASGATLGSGVLTAWHAVVPLMAYYPRYPISTLRGALDPYSQAGFYLAFFSALLAVKEAREAPATGPSWQRSSSNLRGNSDWLPISAARRKFQAGGIIIGEAYRPDRDPEVGGKAPTAPLWWRGRLWALSRLRWLRRLQNHRCRHPMYAGVERRTCLPRPVSRSLPNGARRARSPLGHRVVSLNPEDGCVGFNVLDWIDTSTDRSLMDIHAVVAWLTGEQVDERNDDYFKHAARGLLGCLLADILFAPGLLREKKTLALLRKRVALPIPELRQLLEDIYAKGDSYGFGFPAQLAGNLKDITEKQFSGFYGEAGNLTAWLAVPSLARLGYMSILETARDAGRKYGINLLLMYQSLGQMTATWGTQGRQAWFDSSYLKLFGCLHDVSAAEFLSKACGEFTAVSEGYTRGSGSSTGSATSKSSSTHETTSEQQLVRRLIKPEEILQTLRDDEQIVLISNSRPLRCGRAIYFRRPEMLSRTRSNEFEQIRRIAAR